MKKINFAVACLSITLLFAFSGFRKDDSQSTRTASTGIRAGTNTSSGSFSVEEIAYAPTYFLLHLPNLKSSEPFFGMQGWVSKSSLNESSYFISIKGKSVPATGVYPLRDFSETGQASLLIQTRNPDKKSYRAQSGELHITNNGGSITATFKNVPVKSDVGNFKSQATGTITIKL